MKARATARVIGLTVFAVVEGHAANVYNITWDGSVTTTFNPGELGDEPYSTQQRLASSFGGGMTLPNLTADFNADKDLQVNFSAIMGNKIQVLPPTFANTTNDHGRFVISLNSNQTLWGQFFDGVFNNATFTGLEGPAPTVSFGNMQYASNSFGFGSGPHFSAYVTFDFTAPFSFTGVTLNLTAPASMSNIHTNTPVVGNVDVFYEGDIVSGTVSDAGQWVALIAVPEPSGTLLWLCGMSGLAFRRTRRR